MTNNDNELDNFLKDRLKLIEPTPIRDPTIARRTRDKYLRKVKYLRMVKPVGSKTSWAKKKTWKSLLGQPRSLLPFAVSMFLLIGMIFGSWGTVYAAKDSLPNEPLYTVKLMGENLQLSLTSDTNARISLLTNFANRRADEATILTSQGKPIPDQLTMLIDEYQEEVTILTASLDEETLLKNPDGVQIHKRDQDQDMTGPRYPKSDEDPPRTMCKEGEGQDSTCLDLEEQATMILDSDSTAMTTTITNSLELTATMKITPGPDDYEGYGPGPDQGAGPQQPIAIPPPGANEKPKQNPVTGSDTKGNKP